MHDRSRLIHLVYRYAGSAVLCCCRSLYDSYRNMEMVSQSRSFGELHWCLLHNLMSHFAGAGLVPAYYGGFSSSLFVHPDIFDLRPAALHSVRSANPFTFEDGDVVHRVDALTSGALATALSLSETSCVAYHTSDLSQTKDHKRPLPTLSICITPRCSP